MIDRTTAPYLAALTLAEDALEAELAGALSAWERALAIPEGGEASLARFLAQRLLAMMERALVIQRQAWREVEAKDLNAFQAARVAYASQQGAALVVNIAAETRERIAAIVAAGAARGLGADAIRREIAPIIEGIAGRSPRQRAAVIARTELHNAAMWAQEQEAVALKRRGGDLVKVWTATMDRRTRPAHRAANGQVREIEADFRVGRKPMRRPGDPRGGPENVIQCRCVARYIPRRQVDDDRQRRAADMVAFAERAADFRAEIAAMTEFMDSELAAVVRQQARTRPAWRAPIAPPIIATPQPAPDEEAAQ